MSPHQDGLKALRLVATAVCCNPFTQNLVLASSMQAMICEFNTDVVVSIPGSGSTCVLGIHPVAAGSILVGRAFDLWRLMAQDADLLMACF